MIRHRRRSGSLRSLLLLPSAWIAASLPAGAVAMGMAEQGFLSGASADARRIVAAMHLVTPPSAVGIRSLRPRAAVADRDETTVRAIKKALPSVVTLMTGEGSSQGMASGVFVSPDGLIVTAAHIMTAPDSRTVNVLDAAGPMSDVTVMLDDKQKLSGKVVRVDESKDLALVKIVSSRRDWPPISFRDPGTPVEVGETVIAIGSPLRLYQTATRGMVSFVGRDLPCASNEKCYPVKDLIQTDASINPGNSGGALIDLSGDLVGINSVVFTLTTGNMGLGFAIPARDVEGFLASYEGRYSISSLP